VPLHPQLVTELLGIESTVQALTLAVLGRTRNFFVVMARVRLHFCRSAWGFVGGSRRWRATPRAEGAARWRPDAGCTKSSASLGNVEVDDVSDVGRHRCRGRRRPVATRMRWRPFAKLARAALRWDWGAGRRESAWRQWPERNESTGDAIGAVLGAHRRQGNLPSFDPSRCSRSSCFLVGGDFKGLQLDVRRGL